MQPKPEVPFTRDGWKRDLRCSFIGPSSLFQRWNLQLRQTLGLLENVEAMPTTEILRILLILRPKRAGASMAASAGNIGGKQTSSSSTPSQISRVFANAPELVNMLNEITTVDDNMLIDIVEQDFSAITFEQQVRLVASSSILIGMHGTGIASAVHMPVGTRHCCGVIEIFPEGEFRTIRGYGNMARRMGHHYRRLELTLTAADTTSSSTLSSNSNSTSTSTEEGTVVPPELLKEMVIQVMQTIQGKPSCLLPAVVKKPLL
jgi:hypothetical protein